MISLDNYFAGYKGHPDITPQIEANATKLLTIVNGLLARGTGDPPRNPDTGTQVSGHLDGGWRPQSCPIGAPNSAHKQGRAVDVYDPDGALDDWLTDEILAQYGLYREHPASTRGWCHLTDRAPPSGKRTFYP